MTEDRGKKVGKERAFPEDLLLTIQKLVPKDSKERRSSVGLGGGGKGEGKYTK